MGEGLGSGEEEMMNKGILGGGTIGGSMVGTMELGGEEEGGWGEDRRGGGQEENRRMAGDRDRLDRGGGGRDRDRDRNGRRRQNEPEWMNECISKSDVIELRGFDNPAKANNRDNREQNNGGVGKPVNLGNLLPGLNNQHESNNKPHPGIPTGGELHLCSHYRSHLELKGWNYTRLVGPSNT